jgi:hypothetical protein
MSSRVIDRTHADKSERRTNINPVHIISITYNISTDNVQTIVDCANIAGPVCKEGCFQRPWWTKQRLYSGGITLRAREDFHEIINVNSH